MNNDSKNLGHFLDYSFWQQALKLLNFQIESQSSNKHFKTLSMIYYRKLGNSIKLESEDYFCEKVATNLFYGLEEEFAIIPYVKPKPGLGLRNYKFLSYPMRATYYAIGLYLVKLADEFLKNFYQRRKKIKGFYGGGIHFEKESLKVTKNNIYFRSYYRQFRTEVRRETKDIDNKIVIRLDIQNYYDVISIPILMELLDKNIKSSVKGNLKFDTVTKEQINFFFRFLSNDGLGIPQSNNSLISSFIGYLYLVFGDLLIENELYKDLDVIEDYKVARYVDDIFISIKFKEDVYLDNQKEYIESIGARVSDLLYYELGLRFNPKTRFYWLNDEDDLDALLAALKKVSPEYYCDDDLDDETPFNKIRNIFDELRKLKKSSIEPETFTHELQDEILKEVFDKRVGQLLSKDTNKQTIERIFDGFDFNRVKEYPLPMLIIILKENKTTDRFKKFLLEKKSLTTRDVDLMLQYLCQIDFKDSGLLIKKLKQYAPMRDIMRVFIQKNIAIEEPGYYSLTRSQALSLTDMPYVIDQIRHRVFNERTNTYSVALSHLLNEIHAICYELDTVPNHKDYKASAVVAFLDKKKVPPLLCSDVRNLFDRRNTNQISHPGSDQNIVWSVSKDEYFGYHEKVGNCLSHLLN